METEKTASIYSVKHFAKNALHDIIHFDTKILRSLQHLVFKPGLLTKEHFLTGSEKYVKPLGLFIFVNFLFFIFKEQGIFQYHLKSFTQSNMLSDYLDQAFREQTTSYEVFEARFNMAMKFQQKSYFIFLVPLFALSLKLLYWKRYYLEHLVFSLHFLAFFLIYLLFIPYLIMAVYFIQSLFNINPGNNELIDMAIILPLVFIWMQKALRTFYPQKDTWISILKAVVMVIYIMVLIILVYRTMLFFIVLNSL